MFNIYVQFRKEPLEALVNIMYKTTMELLLCLGRFGDSEWGKSIQGEETVTHQIMS